jgi:3-deoxy-7-phosphoheptulonate synthase
MNMASQLSDLHIQAQYLLPTPRQVRQELPHTAATTRTVAQGREVIERILDQEDHRLMVIVGPCSIHDVEACSDYARRLHALAKEVSDALFIVMRVYFEKPRTRGGWKGFINDPYMDGSFRIDEGLRLARRFLLQVAELGLPAASEVLNPLTPQYIGDLISWSSIGARTTESQTHRQLASGLSTAVGFKNTTDGSVDSAINAIHSALQPHRFLGVTEDGLPAIYCTTGNPYLHIVLRGGAVPNFDAASIRACEKALQADQLPVRIVVDCSHGNSGKDPEKQPAVIRDVMDQIEKGNRSIVGIMVESFLESGSQSIPKDLAKIRRGVSVTDACLGWDATADALRELHRRYARVMAGRGKKAGG